MEINVEKYRVAGQLLAITDCDGCRSWERVRRAYQPFSCDDVATPDCEIVMRCAPISLDGLRCIVDEEKFRGADDNPNSLMPYRRESDGALVFTVTQPGLDAPHVMVAFSDDFRRADITMTDAAPNSRMHRWMLDASLTSAIQLAYMAATSHNGTLMSHASCVKWQGRAYLFIAKSGTGKSTHSCMWLENIPDVELLNDDHPIVRIVDGVPIAYGSPWSGKTPCYKNIQAPVGAIIRINRAESNSICRQSVIAAYASLFASFSGLTFVESQANYRHHALEQLIASVPCYDLYCRPDAEAARVCNGEMANYIKNNL